jgi:predicted dehydrogenase
VKGDTFRVGIIGCGLIGNKRAKVIRDDPTCCLAAACDVAVSNAQSIVDRYGDGSASAYDDWRLMLDKENLDIVVVSTPNNYLNPITSYAAEKKSHVLCEKPLGRNAGESENMVRVAEGNGVVLKTGFNHRYHPAIFRARQLVEEGMIGKVYFSRCIYGHGGRPGYEKEWRANKEICGGGELLDQGVHVVDLFRWFMGDFEEASGYTPTCYWGTDVEDNAFAFFRTAKGQIASMHTSWTQWKNRFTFEIFGEAGYLIIDGLGGSYGIERLKIGKRKKAQGKEEQGEYAGGAPDEETVVFDGPDTSWEEEWRDFLTEIREGRESLGNGRDGLEANRMIEAVYRSARENRPVRIQDR